MNSYYIYNPNTEAYKHIFGHSYEDACLRSNINPNEWIVEDWEYID